MPNKPTIKQTDPSHSTGARQEPYPRPPAEPGRAFFFRPFNSKKTGQIYFVHRLGFAEPIAHTASLRLATSITHKLNALKKPTLKALAKARTWKTLKQPIQSALRRSQT